MSQSVFLGRLSFFFGETAAAVLYYIVYISRNTLSRSIWETGKQMRRVFFAAVFGILASQAAFAVPVYINSGNPSFPFPQFLPYVHPNGDTLHNLATRNPAGVVHAEMEKSTRDAYEIMMLRADYYENINLRGTRYIKYSSNPDCSEGTGYAMLAAAMMADKTTFDGLWLFAHDYTMNRVVRYIDGRNSNPDTIPYLFSTLPGWQNGAGQNSAADGDFDIALALMIAHRQWGDNMGINDSRGRPISYKDDFIQILKGLSDTLTYRNDGKLLSGDIGIDGYIKGGDSWAQLSGWSDLAQNLASIGINSRGVYQPGPDKQHIDYAAPAYFRQFSDYLKQENANTYRWNIFQFERAEASSDWLFGKHISQDQRNIPFAGWVELKNDTTPVFTSFNEGEDFRAAWRTVLSYVWHGNPKDSWDPVRHVVIRDRSNTYQYDAGLRFSRFLWDRRQTPWNQQCEELLKSADKAGLWWGPSMLRQNYTPQGERLGQWWLNWVQGTGSPSAVTAQDTGLMAEMYRQNEIEWDVDNPEDRYIKSRPFYFHGFFRLLGMNVLTGNHHAPLNMKRGANMKVYLDVDKTYAFENDTITYTIDYRNYGAEAANGVVITNRLHSDMVYISSTGGGSYDAASNSVKWDIGNVSGFNSNGGVNPTKGTVSFKIIIPYANQKRYENRAQITCTNGSGWTSNEYPNKISSVMKRNGVDIARRALLVAHSVYRDTVNPGMNATYTINFENSAEAGWLNGGRPGVNFTYAHSGTPATSGSHTFMLRAFHDAHEAYIDYGNYRISYFLFDNSYTGLAPPYGTAANGWSAPHDILYVPEAEKSKFTLRHENITPGEDSRGKWNQRLILQIANPEDPSRTDTNWNTMAAPTQFLENYFGHDNRVHRGISTPFKGVWRMFGGNNANRNWGGDWSNNTRAAGTISNDDVANWGYPVSPDFTENYDPDYQGKPVTAIHRKLCGTPPSTTIDNVLIEEWDGYTWRRVFGNGPVPGREVNNVIIRDTIPAGVTFQNFLTPYPFGIEPKTSTAANGRTVVTWEIDKLLVGQSGKIQYVVRAETPASFPTATSSRVTSRAWASADKESPTSATALLVITSDSLPPPPPEATTLYKTANKETYEAGDTITYTIAYKQTHGYPVKSSSRSEWVGTNASSRVSANGDTITFNDATDIYHRLSYGTNGVLTGTAHPGTYQNFSIFARSENSARKVEINFDQQYDGIHVTITSNGQTTVAIPSPFAYDIPSGAFDYKIVLRQDSLLLWIRDTSAAIPSWVQTGIPIQAGYAGVIYTTAGYGSGSLTGWASHFDLAYDVVIRDTIPWGVTYIDNSATGRINTVTPPRQLTANVNNNVITWQKIDTLGANDSVTVTWKGVVDTAKNGMIINTGYTDLAGYPKDSIGAQLRSKFTLAIVEPPDTGDIDTTQPPPPPPPPPPGMLGLLASHNSCIYTGTLSVTLESVPSDAAAVIYYTRNNSQPDVEPRFTYASGQPIEIYGSDYTLKALAEDPTGENEPSDVLTRVYQALKTVPVRSAIFFDDVGDGKAHGIKLALSAAAMEQTETVTGRHFRNLIEISGIPYTAIDSGQVRVVGGDTVVIPFRNGIDPASNTKLTIREPVLPGSSYTSAHGYLAETNDLTVIDGVAPVITKAVYRQSLLEGVSGDTLVVTFNKPAVIADKTGEITPFTLSYSRGAHIYELLLVYDAQGVGNSIYFLVLDIDGDIRLQGDLVQAGDSIRINAASGQISNYIGAVQTNPHNSAVPLEVPAPTFDYAYEVKTGPSPLKVPAESLRIWISMTQYVERAFEALKDNANVRIYDMMGNVVAMSGEKLRMERVSQNGERYLLVWNGSNRKGRLVGTGAYVVYVVLTDPNGNRHTFKQKVYLRCR